MAPLLSSWRANFKTTCMEKLHCKPIKWWAELMLEICKHLFSLVQYPMEGQIGGTEVTKTWEKDGWYLIQNFPPCEQIYPRPFRKSMWQKPGRNQKTCVNRLRFLRNMLTLPQLAHKNWLRCVQEEAMANTKASLEKYQRGKEIRCNTGNVGKYVTKPAFSRHEGRCGLSKTDADTSQIGEKDFGGPQLGCVTFLKN